VDPITDIFKTAEGHRLKVKGIPSLIQERLYGRLGCHQKSSAGIYNYGFTHPHLNTENQRRQTWQPRPHP